MEELLQFELAINYIKGEDNTVANALLRLPPDHSPVLDYDPRGAMLAGMVSTQCCLCCFLCINN